MTRLRQELILLGAIGLVAAAIPLALAAASDEDRLGLIVVFGPLIGLAYTGTGLFAWWRRPHNRIGALMVMAGFAHCLAGLILSTNPWLFTIGVLFFPLPYAFLFHILLAFPTGLLTRWYERLVVAVTYGRATVGNWAAIAFQDPAQHGLTANPILGGDRLATMSAIDRAHYLLGIVLITALAVILIHRWRRASRPQRNALAPVLISGGLVMALWGLWYAATIAGVFPRSRDLLQIAGVVALAVVPFAFLGGLLRSRVAQAGAVTALVTRLGDERDRRDVLRDGLAEALGDPSLTLAYWLPERGEYVDAEGRRVELPAENSGRMCTPVDGHGQRIAMLLHDASLAEEGELVRAVGAAAALTLENERLDAALRARLAELQESRARIVESGDAARRHIERDLHDGAQQRLVSIALTLRLAQSRVEDEPTAAQELLQSASQDLEVALAELRELARGIHPVILSERGLHVALQGLASRAPLPVELADTLNERMPPKLEAAAYYVVAEAITNVAKYAQASHATVAVRRDKGVVLVEVADDGVGGADPDHGTGLRGLADRVSALDGRLEVFSPTGQGTTIRARIPCG